jgi:hypothetical protein
MHMYAYVKAPCVTYKRVFVCMLAQAFADQADKVINETQAQVDFMGECFYQEEYMRRLQKKFPRTVNDTDGWDEVRFV